MFNFSRLTKKKKKKKGPYLKINNLKKRISAKTKKCFFWFVFFFGKCEEMFFYKDAL